MTDETVSAEDKGALPPNAAQANLTTAEAADPQVAVAEEKAAPPAAEPTPVQGPPAPGSDESKALANDQHPGAAQGSTTSPVPDELADVEAALVPKGASYPQTLPPEGFQETSDGRAFVKTFKLDVPEAELDDDPTLDARLQRQTVDEAHSRGVQLIGQGTAHRESVFADNGSTYVTYYADAV